MRAEDVILEQWFADTVEACSTGAIRPHAAEQDRFLNPVEYALRENLAILLREVLGEMDTARARPALEAIVRVRAVQGVTASQAVGFVFTLRSIVKGSLPKTDAVLLNRKIDHLALMAFEEYVHVREHLSEIRLNEGRRAMAVPAALSRVRS